MFKSTGMKPLDQHVYLSSPTMHGEEFQYMKEAYDTNWMSTVGANINEVEKIACEKIGCKHAVALSAGTAALQQLLTQWYMRVEFQYSLIQKEIPGIWILLL